MKSSAAAVWNSRLRNAQALGRPLIVLLVGGSPSLLERCRGVMSSPGVVVEHMAEPSRRRVAKLRPFLLLATRDAYAEDPLEFTRLANAAHAMLLLVAESTDEVELRSLIDWALGAHRQAGGVGA